MSLSSLINKLKGATSPTAIEHEELQAACLAGTHHVIDVRELHEFASGHLPGAINHPLSSFNPSLLPSDRPVVFVCKAGSRSAKALESARVAGRNDVSHYTSGTAGWKAMGGKFVI